ncbi:hypothetical protein Peur_049902 [Populus x canadensis]|uniref:EF-hand domain-containing protein n=1 Tax=Populus deltoides TaxID=3696 RepID=A0A8T2YRX6_POPDE|nr:uncharacterized protein LOC133695273 [Populus nigra]XP_061973173.1 uncharacterized protein LOC133695273 [Populus nigra]XP_061973174.1 uncharacterized protein LOC133695273 [Populus nigra]KAH8507918.1 hypothetical protein H0E87_010172 [Populus deltoides]KAH8507919.1 hypothetical protein H0E87_010172 [Populus deltoides]
MSKTSIIIYITIALLFLLLVTQTPNKPSNHRNRRIKIRSKFDFEPRHHNHHHEPVPFDPLVADIERKREDKEWEKQYFEHSHPEFVHDSAAAGHESQPEWEDFIDAEDYVNDEEKFNVTNRLLVLFPKIDVEPDDGYVSEHELTEWNLKQSEKEVMHRTKREMDVHDKNHDGFVSFAEYEPPSWVRNSDKNSFGYDMGWWKEEHFNASDADGDGFLNITEFNDFQHPADSKNPKLLQWLCKEEVRERDSDKDGKVNFQEFFHGLFDLVRNYDEEGHNSSHLSDNLMEAPAKKLFDELDKDGDGFLSDIELLPIIGKLHPSERYYAKQQADYILSQADTDKDGRLSLTEMIENPYVFYSAIFSDEDDDYDIHDEFR